MKITAISVQVKNANRVSVSVDGKYRFSLDVYQVSELGLRVGAEYSETDLIALEEESQFGKLYARALEYCLMRPHSAREVRDYLWRKTRPRKVLRPTSRDKSSDAVARKEVVERPGVSQAVADRVYGRLVEKAYIDDEVFARYWVENRNQTKGMSRRKLEAELRTKGVSSEIITRYLQQSARSDANELEKMIAKKRMRYPDEQKLMQYLARQGFSYDDIRTALEDNEAA